MSSGSVSEGFSHDPTENHVQKSHVRVVRVLVSQRGFILVAQFTAPLQKDALLVSGLLPTDTISRARGVAFTHSSGFRHQGVDRTEFTEVPFARIKSGQNKGLLCAEMKNGSLNSPVCVTGVVLFWFCRWCDES